MATPAKSERHSPQCEDRLSRGKGSVKEDSTILDPGAGGESSLCCSQTRVGAERMGSLGVGGQGCEETPWGLTA